MTNYKTLGDVPSEEKMSKRDEFLYWLSYAIIAALVWATQGFNQSEVFETIGSGY